GQNDGIELQTRPILHPGLDFEDLGIVFAQVMLRAPAQPLVPKAIALFGRGSAEEPARQRSRGGDQKIAAGDFHNSILCIEPARAGKFSQYTSELSLAIGNAKAPYRVTERSSANASAPV